VTNGNGEATSVILSNITLEVAKEVLSKYEYWSNDCWNPDEILCSFSEVIIHGKDESHDMSRGQTNHISVVSLIMLLFTVFLLVQ